MSCKNCKWYQVRNTKDRPLFCCKCELNYAWNEFYLELPGYKLLIKISDYITIGIEKIRTLINK